MNARREIISSVKGQHSTGFDDSGKDCGQLRFLSRQLRCLKFQR